MAIGFTNISTGGGVRGLSAQPQDVRMGMTFTTDSKTVQTGTMNLVSLVPENIKKDVNIGGVVGTYSEVLEKMRCVYNQVSSGGEYEILKQNSFHISKSGSVNLQKNGMSTAYTIVRPKILGYIYVNFWAISGKTRPIFLKISKYNGDTVLSTYSIDSWINDNNRNQVNYAGSIQLDNPNIRWSFTLGNRAEWDTNIEYGIQVYGLFRLNEAVLNTLIPTIY